MVSIVQVNVNLQIAPSPSTLQKTGAMISQGGTTKPAGSLTLLTQMADLTAILAGAKTLTTLAWAGGVVTATATAPHGLTVGDTLMVTIAGAAPAGYNGTFLATVTTASAFTYPVALTPGTMTLAGTYTSEDVAELVAMGTTFFAQGNTVAVYVLELGLGGPADGVTALTTWINNNVGTVYSYLVPRTWDNAASFLAMLQSFEAPTAKTYFFVTTTLANYASYTALMKCVVSLVEAPGITPTEFSIASLFYASLHYAPSNTNKVAPFAFTYVFGVTPYPTVGNQALLTTLKTNGVNVIGTGAEGGISNTMILWGMTEDSRDFTYWYSVDYVQIQSEIVLANEVINGSNNAVNPLYYDQHGINRLQARLAQLMTNVITFGLGTGSMTQVEMDGPTLSQAIDDGDFVNQAVINAVPFVPYALANPQDFKSGRYAGLSVIYIPARGFTQIVVNIVVSDFISV
jgi:hypothetical protein